MKNVKWVKIAAMMVVMAFGLGEAGCTDEVPPSAEFAYTANTVTPTDLGSGLEVAGDAGSISQPDTEEDSGSGSVDTGSATADAGSGTVDAGSGTSDAGSGSVDAGSGKVDAGSGTTDAGSPDTGTDVDNNNPDAGSPDAEADVDNNNPDAGSPDAGADVVDNDSGSSDAGQPDTINPDAGSPDTGADVIDNDSGSSDAGQPDTITPDSGSSDAGTDVIDNNPDSGSSDAGQPDTINPDAGSSNTGADVIDNDSGSSDAGTQDVGPPITPGCYKSGIARVTISPYGDLFWFGLGATGANAKGKMQSGKKYYPIEFSEKDTDAGFWVSHKGGFGFLCEPGCSVWYLGGKGPPFPPSGTPDKVKVQSGKVPAMPDKIWTYLRVFGGCD